MVSMMMSLKFMVENCNYNAAGQKRSRPLHFSSVIVAQDMSPLWDLELF